MQTEKIREIIGRFDTAGTVADLRAVGNGWINDTYRVMTVSDETPDYILQRINHHVFKDVELLQRNIERVTSHILAMAHLAAQAFCLVAISKEVVGSARRKRSGKKRTKRSK